VSRRRLLRFQNSIVLIALAAVAPGWMVATALLWRWEAASTLRGLLFTLMTLASITAVAALRARMVRPLQSLANLLEALREGDYSQRGRVEDPADALGEVMVEVNKLSRTLHHRRLDEVEAGALLEKLIAEVDIAVLAFDDTGRLRLLNRAAERLLGGNAERLRGRTLHELGLDALAAVPSGHIVPHVFPGGSGRWEIRRRSFREGGRPHELIVISELSRALREEERQTWQRLVRVIGHELNNSLAPIKSMANTLRTLIARDPPPADWREDTLSALGVISDRAESLARFMGAYARLARLPAPRKTDVCMPVLAQRAVSLQASPRIVIEGGPQIVLHADADQLEQALINLLKNGLEATGDAGGVRVRWFQDGDWLLLEIEDDGPGIAATDNLWVPFFTTKPGGSGIGLVLCREILERHGGTIALENRTGASGCIARLRLPLAVDWAAEQ
jgi:two-component system, NtrC family, nitrogen regulation sensor histidine kinase NtrY